MRRSEQPGQPELLLVEDNPGDVRLAEEAFRASGIPCRHEVAWDGEQALKRLVDRAEDPPRLVVLDINLPRKSGLDVLEEIRGDRRWDDVAVVVFTTSPSEAEMDRAYAHGANSYVIKPIDLDEYMAAMAGIQRFWLRPPVAQDA